LWTLDQYGFLVHLIISTVLYTLLIGLTKEIY
jgi:hypothetical protein